MGEAALVTTPAASVRVEDLRSVPLFAELPEETLVALTEEVQVRHFDPGESLMLQGSSADALYIIRSGRVEVDLKSPHGRDRVIGSMGPGEVVGELGMLTGGTRTATVRAVEPTDALELRRDAFTAVMERGNFSHQIAVVLADRLATQTRIHGLEEPPLSQFLFGDPRLAGFWLVVRLWLGYQWLESGLAKVTSPGWMNGGQALKGFWQAAITVSGPNPAIAYPWYRSFIEFLLTAGAYTWFAKLIAVGEVAVGLGLVLGLLTGVAATGGLLMNSSYLLAGSASINPVLAALEVPIILAWKVAGWWGLDRFILGPLLKPRARGADRAAAQLSTARVSPPATAVP